MSIKNVYPDSNPLLNLDFVNSKKIDPRFQFSRASTGTYIDANGILRTAAIGEPRFDHNPVTGECKGLLIEEQLTNIFRNHSTFSGQSCAASTSNLNWTNNNVSISSNQIISPDGTLTAARITSNGSGAYLASNAAGYPSAFGVNIGSQRCLSIFVKAGSVSGVTFRQGGGSDYGYTFNIGTNAPEQIFQFGYSIKYPNGWFRLVISRYLFNGGTILINPSPSNAGDSIFIWGPQGEIAERASSYIPAPGNSNVTRQPDQLVLNNAPVASEGTFYLEATPRTGTGLVVDNGSSALTLMPTINQTTKNVLFYNTSKILRMSSGNIPLEIFDTIPQNLNRISLGFNIFNIFTNSYINGHIKNFKYYASLLNENNLRSLTGNTNNTIIVDDPLLTITGGTITEIVENDIVYRVHTFTTVGTSVFDASNITSILPVEYLVVAGGGAGGSSNDRSAGGGGAGGILMNSSITPLTITSEKYTIVVGAGGTGVPGELATGNSGGNSSVFNLTSFGGGGGAGSRFSVTTPGNGGSGGGGAAGTVGVGVPGQGNNGGSGIYSQGGSFGSAGGGGGGYLGVGGNASSPDTAGNGGPGIVLNITGTAIAYAGGGGGGLGTTGGGSNGIGGGSVANRGGGGSGGFNLGNNGGSGIVIIRYAIGVVGQ